MDRVQPSNKFMAIFKGKSTDKRLAYQDKVKKTEQKMKRVYDKVTSDDWCPNYYGPEYGERWIVKVFVHFCNPEQTYLRVSVWGADDLGMEYDREDITDENRDRAWEEANLFAGGLKEPLTFKGLEELGFKRS